MKELIILRGVSGSGKSTLAKDHIGETGVIYSTDDFFMENNVYEFDPKKLFINHRKNQERTKKAMAERVTPIIIDNTNCEAWEMKPYVQMADEYGYKVKIIETEPLDIEELIQRQENRRHYNKFIPRELLEKMIQRYRRNISLDEIRNSN